MQFSALIALLATTVAAVPFNSSIEARGLNVTYTLMPRGLNVTNAIETRGLNDTAVLVGRSANVSVRSYNVTKREAEPATFPRFTLPKPLSGIFEGNKNIHAVPNKTTEAGPNVKRSYGSYGTGTPFRA